MKKTILATALVMTMSLAASAQSDGFFSKYDNGGNREISDPSKALVMPGTPLGSDDNSNASPLGSGLLVLTALGAVYALKENYKKRNNNK